MQNRDSSPNGDDGGKVEDFRWAALVAHVLHPHDVQILEALGRTGRPLSAGDLSKLFDGDPSCAKVAHRLHRLSRFDAVELAATPTLRNVADIPYRLVRLPDDDDVPIE
jgi:hypothetical protein